MSTSDKAAKFNAGKPELSLILEARNAMTEAAKVLQYGKMKYARSNWKKGLPATVIADSLLRHLTMFLSGETTDEESGLDHRAHVLVNALFLAEFIDRPDLDDRGDPANDLVLTEEEWRARVEHQTGVTDLHRGVESSDRPRKNVRPDFDYGFAPNDWILEPPETD